MNQATTTDDKDQVNRSAADLAAAALESAKAGSEDGAIVDDAETVTLTSLIVLIEHDQMSKAPSRVFEHELPVLFELHGEDKVTVVEGSAEEVDVDVADVREMYDQLLRKYGKKGENAVRTIYPRVSDLAEELGVEVRRTRVRGSKYKPDTQQSEQVDHSKAGKTVTTASGGQARGRAAASAATSARRASTSKAKR